MKKKDEEAKKKDGLLFLLKKKNTRKGYTKKKQKKRELFCFVRLVTNKRTNERELHTFIAEPRGMVHIGTYMGVL